MIKRKYMKYACLCLAMVILAIGSAGCSSASNTTSDKSSSKASSVDSSAASTKPKEIAKLKLFYSEPELYPGWKFGDDPLTKALSEETGVTLEIKYASNSDNQELYTMLASGSELPDLMYVNKYDPMFVNEQFVQPLNKLADKYYKEFYDSLPYQYADVHKLADGNIYYWNSMYADSKRLAQLPGGKKGVSSMAVNINAWEKMGKPSIATLAGVKEAALQAKKDGIAYPVFLYLASPIHNLHYSQFVNVCFGGPGFVYPQRDGTVTFNCKSEQYKKGMQYLNDLFRSGLIQADNFTFDMTTKDENVKKIATTGNAFFVFGQEFVMRQFRSSTGVGGTADAYLFRVQDIPLGDGVSRNQIKMDDFNASNIGTTGGWYIMNDTKYPAESIRFLSTIGSEKWQMLFASGKEGVVYNIDKSVKDGNPSGYKVLTSEYLSDSSKLSASDMMKKYGDHNLHLTTLRTRNVQVYFDRPFFGVAKINGADTMLGDYMVDLGLKYSTPFKTGSLTANITETNDKLLYDNVIKTWKESEPALVLAKDTASFEAAYQKMISDMNKVGLANLEKILTERYKKYDELLKETRNENVAGAGKVK